MLEFHIYDNYDLIDFETFRIHQQIFDLVIPHFSKSYKFKESSDGGGEYKIYDIYPDNFEALLHWVIFKEVQLSEDILGIQDEGKTTIGGKNDQIDQIWLEYFTLYHLARELKVSGLEKAFIR